MSEENVQVIERWLASYIETGEIDLELLDPNVEVQDHDLPDAGLYHGLGGFERWLRDWADAWADYTLEPEELLDAGDRVVLVAQMRATGKGSGVELRRQDAIVYEMRGTKIVRIDYFNNRREALEAAGLSE